MGTVSSTFSWNDHQSVTLSEPTFHRGHFGLDHGYDPSVRKSRRARPCFHSTLDPTLTRVGEIISHSTERVYGWYHEEPTADPTQNEETRLENSHGRGCGPDCQLERFATWRTDRSVGHIGQIQPVCIRCSPPFRCPKHSSNSVHFTGLQLMGRYTSREDRRDP